MSASVDLLKAARAKIADTANWTQGCNARLPTGEPTYSFDIKACSWCAIGAARSEGADRRLCNDLDAASQSLFQRSVSSANDILGHEAALKIYDLAIACAEAANA